LENNLYKSFYIILLIPYIEKIIEPGDKPDMPDKEYEWT